MIDVFAHNTVRKSKVLDIVIKGDDESCEGSMK